MSVELSEDVAAFIRDARVARLATIGPEGPHVVPICPALDDGRLLIATEPSRKVENLRTDDRVGVAFDEYGEDWSRLRGVSVSGRATIHAAGEVWERCRRLLYEKYPQYETDAEIVPGRTLVLEIELAWVSRGGL